jgi:uncharacterized protein (DUF1800 family)
MYSFFVEDEPPVPEWPYKEPNNPKAIEDLSKIYFDTGYNIKEMLRFLFKSDFFKSEKVWNKRVKSPIELVAGTLRITKEFERPDKQQSLANSHTSYMGQHAMNPPSVEGWHWGTEWLDSGTVVERVNFASLKLGNVNNYGIRKIINNVKSNISNQYSADFLIENILEELGSNISELLQLIGAMPEFQRA